MTLAGPSPAAIQDRLMRLRLRKSAWIIITIAGAQSDAMAGRLSTWSRVLNLAVQEILHIRFLFFYIG
jgi:hypothetical protein